LSEKLLQNNKYIGVKDGKIGDQVHRQKYFSDKYSLKNRLRRRSTYRK